MGLIAGLVIGLWCQRLATAFAWCLGVAAISSGAFAVGAVTAGGVPLVTELAVLPVLIAIALLPLLASAGVTISVRRLLARRARPVATARFGAPPPAAPNGG